MKKIIILMLLPLAALFSCEEKGVQPIAYGKDKCAFCTMKIMDNSYGTELVDTEGKAYKFDSSECMIRFMHQNADKKYTDKLSNYYESVGELIPVEEATFLVSDNLPSPMGAGITAFKTKEDAQKMQQEKTGEVYTFGELEKTIE